jgi:hypothetical protein
VRFATPRWLLSGSGLLLMAAGLAVRSVAAPPADPPRLLLHVPFEPAAWVSQASGRPDILCFGPQTVDGKVGKAAEISTFDQSFEMNQVGNLDRRRGSLCLWYKPSFSRGAGETYPLLWSARSSGHDDHAFMLWLWRNQVRFDLREPGQGGYCSAETKSWKPDEWRHLATTWDAKAGITLWVDGKKVAENTQPCAAVDALSILLGTDFDKSAFACGALDELKVFDRVLTAEEIAADCAGRLVAVPAPKAPPPPARKADVAPVPLKTLFELDFENGFAAKAVGEAKPTNANLPAIVDGVMGKGARFPAGAALRFAAPGNLDIVAGAISCWIQPPPDYLDETWTYLFCQEQEIKAGETDFALWMVGPRGLRYDIRNRPAADNMLYIKESLFWRPGEWHHVLCNWDQDGTVEVTVDGVLSSVGSGGGDSARPFLRNPWRLPQPGALIFGAINAAGDNAWRGAIDEVRIFNRPLTADEARTEVARVAARAVRATLIDPYLFAGRAEACRVDFTNWRNAELRLAPLYSVKDASDKEVLSGVFDPFTIPVGGTVRATLSLNLPEPGACRLEISFPEADGLTPQSKELIAVAAQESASGSGRLELVAEVDAAQAPVLAETVPSHIVKSPLGAYREGGGDFHDRFAFKFSVKEIGQPHVIVVQVPDDKRRTMEVLCQPVDGFRPDYQGQGGIFTGDEYPLSNKLIEHRITFWPLAVDNCLIFKTNEPGAPAAVTGFQVFRLPDGLAALPVKAFRGSVPARRIGMYYEDPVLASNYGSLPGLQPGRMNSFPGFGTVVDRMLDYLESFGQDTLQYPIVWYGGPLYGSAVEPLAAATRSHPYGFPLYLAKRLEARGMRFNGWFHVQQFPSLAPLAIVDEERVLAGEETVLNMRGDNHLYYMGWHHRDPTYNPIDPRVQEMVKDMVAEILDRFGASAGFEGITFNVVECSPLAFGSILSGYNDCNLRRFQDETGVRIPVDPASRYRFVMSYRWLMENAREAWVAWRCQKIHGFYKELAAMVKAKRPDLQFRVSLYSYPVYYEQAGPESVNYLSTTRKPVEWYREQGIDPALFEQDDDIVLVRHQDMRLRHNRGHRGTVLPNIETLRTNCLSPEIAAPWRKLPAATLNLHDVYWESNIGVRSPLNLPPPATEHGWRVAQLNANTFHALEQYACGMDAVDPVEISKGGFVVGLNGMEPYLAAFAKAFRALPAVKFDDVNGFEDPVRCRQQVVDGKNYFYLQNRLPIPVEAEVRVEGAGGVTDLVQDAPTAIAGGAIKLTLAPYELRSFRGEDARTRVAGGSGIVPAEFAEGLKAQLAKAEENLARVKEIGVDVAAYLPFLAFAKECWEAKRFARLYFLLQESWVQTAARLADDKALQAFLKAPPGYLASIQKARSVKAVRAGQAPKIDGTLDDPAWQSAPEFADVSDFCFVDGKRLAKQAALPMTMRILYDDKNLYFGVACAEDAPAAVKVVKAPRDSALWVNDDAVELFLHSPAMGEGAQVQLAVNAGGSVTDLLNSDLAWNGDWQAAAKPGEKGWTAEFAIPFATLTQDGSSASGWNFNVARTRRDQPKSAMVATTEDEWKCVKLFATISFEP